MLKTTIIFAVEKLKLYIKLNQINAVQCLTQKLIDLWFSQAEQRGSINSPKENSFAVEKMFNFDSPNKFPNCWYEGVQKDYSIEIINMKTDFLESVLSWASKLELGEIKINGEN